MWMSPELLWPEEFDLKDAKPTKESDVYALGILIYEVRAFLVGPLQLHVETKGE